jgi:hypothetical protein
MTRVVTLAAVITRCLTASGRAQHEKLHDEGKKIAARWTKEP